MKLVRIFSRFVSFSSSLRHTGLLLPATRSRFLLPSRLSLFSTSSKPTVNLESDGNIIVSHPDKVSPLSETSSASSPASSKSAPSSVASCTNIRVSEPQPISSAAATSALDQSFSSSSPSPPFFTPSSTSISMASPDATHSSANSSASTACDSSSIQLALLSDRSDIDSSKLTINDQIFLKYKERLSTSCAKCAEKNIKVLDAYLDELQQAQAQFPNDRLIADDITFVQARREQEIRDLEAGPRFDQNSVRAQFTSFLVFSGIFAVCATTFMYYFCVWLILSH